MIRYLVDGADAPLKAVEKVKQYNVEFYNQIDIFAPVKVLPIGSEAFNSGGGLYRFDTLLGEQGVKRMTKTSTNSNYTYENIAVDEKTLTVQLPLESPVYAYVESDVIQMDGLNLALQKAEKIIVALNKAKITTDIENLVAAATAGDINVVDGTAAAADPYQALALVKNTVANCGVITTATNPDGMKYFSGDNGYFTSAQIKVFMNPIVKSYLSNAITRVGAGSDLEYREFVSGSVPMINGAEIIEYAGIPVEYIFVMPPNSIGQPDPDVIITKIVQSSDAKGIQRIYGSAAYDSVVLIPELIYAITVPPAAFEAPLVNKSLATPKPQIKKATNLSATA